MRFYVIYSFDVTSEMSVVPFKPPCIKQWRLTEDDDNYEFDYLADETGDEKYRNGKHRKYVAELNKKQFKRFIEECNMVMDDVETLGSLTEFGHLPAFSFNVSDAVQSDYYELIWCNAYVTPLPEHVIKGKHLNNSQNERNWNRIKQALLNLYSYNETYASETYRNYHFGKD